jgi:hypothetical protein
MRSSTSNGARLPQKGKPPAGSRGLCLFRVPGDRTATPLTITAGGTPCWGWVAPKVAPPYARRYRATEGRVPGTLLGPKRRRGAGCGRSWDLMLAGIPGGCRAVAGGRGVTRVQPTKKGAHGAWCRAPSAGVRSRGHAASASPFEGSWAMNPRWWSPRRGSRARPLQEPIAPPDSGVGATFVLRAPR